MVRGGHRGGGPADVAVPHQNPVGHRDARHGHGAGGGPPRGCLAGPDEPAGVHPGRGARRARRSVPGSAPAAGRVRGRPLRAQGLHRGGHRRTRLPGGRRGRRAAGRTGGGVRHRISQQRVQGHAHLRAAARGAAAAAHRAAAPGVGGAGMNVSHRARALVGSRAAGYAVFVVLLLTVPAVFTRVPFYTMSVAVLMCLQATAALGLVPLVGRAGQISLGQAAFFAVGGYTSAILTGRWHVNALLALTAGAALAMAVAYVVGLFIFRAQGQYLALATLSFGLVVSSLANQLPLTGASNGLAGIPSLAPFGVELDTDLSVYYLVAGVLLVAVLSVDALLRSPAGDALSALGDSPVATEAAGVSAAALRRGALALAAGLASVAGSLYAHWSSFMDSGQAGLLNSVQLLVIASVGGLRTPWGAPLGALVIVTFSEASKDLIPKVFPSATGNFDIIVYGIALIAVLLFLPRGVGGVTAVRRERSVRKRQDGPAPATTARTQERGTQ
ncbi:branched amino acid transport system permease [Streptomyces lividans TK24]|nr:branched amino acid transport system permease [Streptomyces lividans TK24]